MDHPQAVNTLAMERYLLREMAAEEQDAFEDHYFSCSECAEDARASALMQEEVAGGHLSASGVTAARANRATVSAFRLRRTGWRTSIVLPWAAAAMLAIGLGYETLEGRPSLSRGLDGTFALAPSTLRPASRGEEPAVAIGPGGLLTLAVDLGGIAYDSGVTYELSASDGATIASGSADAPVAGAPLLLVLSPNAVKKGSSYLLTVHNSGSPSLTPQTYRFSVRAR